MVALISAGILLTVLLLCHQMGGITSTVVTGCYVTPTSPLTLSCTAVQKVYIMKVRLGRSACLVINECCPNNTDCVIQPTKHIQYLKKRCDGRHTCIIDMISAWCKGPTDYESVHYVCRSINPAVADTTTAVSTTTTAVSTTTTAVSTTTTAVSTTTTGVSTITVATSHVATESSAAGSTVSSTVDSTARHIDTGSSTTQGAATVSSTTQSTATVSSTTQSTATVSSSADRSESSAGETDIAGSQTNIALIVGVTTAACGVVIASVLVGLVCRRRSRDAGNHQEMDKESVQPARKLCDTAAGRRAEPPDGQQVNHCYGKTVVPPGVTIPTVSLDDLYNKPNKQRKLHQDSQNSSDYACVYEHVTAGPMDDGMTGSGNEELNYVEIDHRGVEGATRDEGSHPKSDGVTYAEIQPKTTSPDTTPLDGDPPGDTDISMVENDLYST